LRHSQNIYILYEPLLVLRSECYDVTLLLLNSMFVIVATLLVANLWFLHLLSIRFCLLHHFRKIRNDVKLYENILWRY